MEGRVPGSRWSAPVILLAARVIQSENTIGFFAEVSINVFVRIIPRLSFTDAFEKTGNRVYEILSDSLNLLTAKFGQTNEAIRAVRVSLASIVEKIFDVRPNVKAKAAKWHVAEVFLSAQSEFSEEFKRLFTRLAKKNVVHPWSV
jgi:hypothetical protein